MKEDFVTYELAVKLRKKGFNIDTDFCYNQDGGIVRVGTCPAPQIHEVLKWLRKEMKLHVVCPFYKDVGFYYYVQRIGSAARIVSSFDDSDNCYDSYEQAALAGVAYCLENLI